MKTTDELFNELMESFSEKTGISVRRDSAPAARLYAMAAQIYALYYQTEWTKKQCFPQTATGEHLDYFAQMRALERKDAACARGTVRFYKSSESDREVLVPAGTVCMTAGLVRFSTDADITIAQGESWGDAAVTAVEPGQFGNIEAQGIISMAVPPVGIEYCENIAATYGGTDQEDDESLRERILASYARLPNGANAAFYESAALSFSDVAAAHVVPRPRGVGSVDVIVAGSAGVPDQVLIDDIQAYLQEIREISVDVQVKAPEIQNVTVAAQVQVADGYDPEEVQAQTKEALREHFSGAILGKGVSRARLGAIIFSVPGVENYVLSQPEADVPAKEGVLPVAESISVEEMEA